MKVSSSQHHTNTTTDILAAFDEFAIGVASETIERCKCNSWKQEDEESFEDVHADLRLLATPFVINAQAR